MILHRGNPGSIPSLRVRCGTKIQKTFSRISSSLPLSRLETVMRHLAQLSPAPLCVTNEATPMLPLASTAVIARRRHSDSSHSLVSLLITCPQPLHSLLAWPINKRFKLFGRRRRRASTITFLFLLWDFSLLPISAFCGFCLIC